MDYLIYGRAAPGAAEVDTPELDEAHWSYMDAFVGRMTARGPTLSADRETWTGSLHVVDLENETAAHAFAMNDPHHRAGLLQDHLIRRFGNLLGRTMWDITLTSPLDPRTCPSSSSSSQTLSSQTPDRSRRPDRCHGHLPHHQWEIHPWEFGGRR